MKKRIFVPLFACLVVGCASFGGGPERARVTLLEGLPVTPAVNEASSGPLLADVYLPASSGVRPAVLVIHPGAWRSGSRRDVGHIARRFAEAGFVAVAPDHRLAPEHVFPAQLDDVAAATRWLRSQAVRFGIDPSRVGAFGYSSGGHLAALLGTRPPAGARLQAVAVGGAISDIEAIAGRFVVKDLIGSGGRAALNAASPLRFVTADDPPFFVHHGRLDFLVRPRHARALHERLSREGVPARLHFGPLGHFTGFLAGSGVDEAIGFLDTWLRDERRLAQTRARAGEWAEARRDAPEADRAI